MTSKPSSPRLGLLYQAGYELGKSTACILGIVIVSAILALVLRGVSLHYTLPRPVATQLSSPAPVISAERVLTLNLKPLHPSNRTILKIESRVPPGFIIALYNSATLLGAGVALVLGTYFRKNPSTVWASRFILMVIPLLAATSTGGRLGWYLGSWEPVAVGHIQTWIWISVMLLPHGLLEVLSYCIAWASLRVAGQLSVPIIWFLSLYGLLFFLLCVAGWLEMAH